MREVQFLQKNRDKWVQFEKMISDSSDINPDKLADYYVETMDDLSYAQTFYPGSKTAKFLNSLSSRIHIKIYKNKKEGIERFKKFWLYEVPGAVADNYKFILTSLAVFVLGILTGVVSNAIDDTFVRSIIGDGYINQTLSNIENGDPLGIYKQKQVFMFLYIMFNNILVSFFVFSHGIILIVGAAYKIVVEGIRIGAFFSFFWDHELFWTAFGTVMIHGTVELTSIVIAGAAGIIIGKSFLFPKTYSRMESFKRGAGQAMKMLVGLVPLFMIAAFIEAFVTRYYQISPVINWAIIILSLAFLTFYFWYYPMKLRKMIGKHYE